MNNVLKNILTEKKDEVSLLYENIKYVNNLKSTAINGGYKRKGRFKNALQKNKPSIIAEIKRRSPLKPHIAAIPEPKELALKYMRGGAAAISVLTDEKFFGGSLADLKSLKADKSFESISFLRKDFIIDEIQIIEALESGADAILLIVAALGRERTGELIAFANKASVDAIVEVHSLRELDTALECGAEIIGINNRSLETFVTDICVSMELRRHIPKDVTAISESGINSVSDARELINAGFDALLIGEFLASAEDPEKIIKEILN